MSDNENTDDRIEEGNDEQERRERVKTLLQETEDSLLALAYEKEKNSELEKLRAKKGKPPELAKMRRSKMSRDDKKKVIEQFGIDVYEEIPR